MYEYINLYIPDILNTSQILYILYSYAFTTTHPSWLENCLQKIYFFVNAIPLSCNWLLPMAVHFWWWEGSQIKNCLKFLYTLHFIFYFGCHFS